MTAGRYEIVGRGSDLGIVLSGPDLLSCLRAAVRGFAAALAEVPDDLERRSREVTVDRAEPAAALVSVLDEAILRLDAYGELAVDVSTVRDGGEASLAVVDLDRVRVHGVAPKAATWHGVRLEETADGWVGEIMLDL